MNSMKKRFVRMQTFFIILAVLITVQMLILYFLQSGDQKRLDLANKSIKTYLQIVERQNNLFDKLHDISENIDRGNQKSINSEIQQSMKDVSAWSIKAVDNGFIPSGIAENEKTRIKSFQKVATLLWQKKKNEALEILKLEKKVFFSHSLMISRIMDEIIQESGTSQMFITSFFLVSILLNVPVFIILLLMTSRLQVNVDKDVNSLVKLADAVRTGTVKEDEGEAVLEEMVVLRKAFKEMELELRNRSMLNKQEVSKTKESNVELEQKIEKSKHVVEQTSSLLERKNKELEQILYAASHDLRTPLIGVQGFSQELQYLCEMLDEEVQKAGVELVDDSRLIEILKKDIPNSVNFIIKGSNKMDTMIQGLLRISRVGLENIELGEVNMDEMVRQIVDVVSFQAQSTNTMILPQPLEDCYGDPENLERVFTNLVVNSIKYRKPDVDCEIKIYSEKNDPFVNYIVEDNGLGVSEENQEKVFKTFFRIHDSDSNGEGLGLTIAKRIIEKHGGEISVESKEGEGCRFIVSLPMIKDQQGGGGE
jgi:signal transduction histidine kinase